MDIFKILLEMNTFESIMCLCLLLFSIIASLFVVFCFVLSMFDYIKEKINIEKHHKLTPEEKYRVKSFLKINENTELNECKNK